MYCKNCGQEIDDNAAICVHCGVAVNGAFNTTQPAQRKPVNKLAVAGFIIALCSTFGSGYCFLIGMLFDMAITFLPNWFVSTLACISLPIAGMVLSILGLVKSKKSNSVNGLAIAGIIISVLMLLLWGSVCISCIMESGFNFN